MGAGQKSHSCPVQAPYSTLALNDIPIRVTNAALKYVTAKECGDWERGGINEVLINVCKSIFINLLLDSVTCRSAGFI